MTNFKAKPMAIFYSYPLFEVQLTADIQMEVHCLQVKRRTPLSRSLAAS